MGQHGRHPSDTDLLNHNSIQFQLDHGALNDFFFNSVTRDQSKHIYRLFLANTVRAVLSLEIHLWPERVKSDRLV